MRWSRYYIPTLKEAPADAEVVSHKLLVRAGMIRKLTSGIYTFLPFGLRALNKAKEIVREEMNRAGAMEVFMPSVQPGDLWRETGRWEVYGKELLRFKDRHERDYCLGPTHEEVITDLLRGEVRSYRQLPLNLYQIQTKFRDEIRPRFGLMRGREFLMKDGYSFDADEEGAARSYKAMYEAYVRAFSRMGLRFRAVEADSGAIGGSFSHEFIGPGRDGRGRHRRLHRVRVRLEPGKGRGWSAPSIPAIRSARNWKKFLPPASIPWKRFPASWVSPRIE